VAKSESVLGLQELNVDLVGSFRRGVLNPRPRRGRDMPTLSPLVEDQKTIVPDHVGTIVVILARDGAGFLKSNLESHVHESFMKDGARHLSTVEPLGTTLPSPVQQSSFILYGYLSDLENRVGQSEGITEGYESPFLERLTANARRVGDLLVHRFGDSGEVNGAQHLALVLRVGIRAACGGEGRQGWSLA
jgi:hypothetical protein